MKKLLLSFALIAGIFGQSQGMMRRNHSMPRLSKVATARPQPKMSVKNPISLSSLSQQTIKRDFSGSRPSFGMWDSFMWNLKTKENKKNILLQTYKEKITQGKSDTFADLSLEQVVAKIKHEGFLHGDEIFNLTINNCPSGMNRTEQKKLVKTLIENGATPSYTMFSQAINKKNIHMIGLIRGLQSHFGIMEHYLELKKVKNHLAYLKNEINSGRPELQWQLNYYKEIIAILRKPRAKTTLQYITYRNGIRHEESIEASSAYDLEVFFKEVEPENKQQKSREKQKSEDNKQYKSHQQQKPKQEFQPNNKINLDNLEHLCTKPSEKELYDFYKELQRKNLSAKEILKPISFNQQDIKKSYYKLMQKYHPDKYSYDVKVQAVASEVSKKINLAYDSLKKI